MYSNLDKALTEKGISRYRLAMETGVPQSSLSRWKKGVAVPKVDKLKKIAAFLQIPLDELIS